MKTAWKTPVAAAALIILLTLVAYLPALRGGFIWDDDNHFTNNPAMLSVEGLKQIWSSLSVSRYYPLTLTVFWVQRRLWGLHPLPYHAVNIGLHASNAALLWMLLRRLKIRGAWFAAAVWALHPVNVETVAWVTELKNTQSGLFFLLALLMFLRFEDGLRPRDYAVALVFGAAAMLSKPSTVVLPAVMLLCAWWRRGQWTRTDFLRVAPLVALGAAMSLVAIVEQRHEIVEEGASGWALTAAERLTLAGQVPWFYAGKVLWPADLCFIYPRWELAAHSVVAWLPLAGLALAAGMLWRFRHANWARAAIFGLGYFILALVPVLGLFDVYFFRYSFVADHFQYVACMGLIALATSSGAAISQWGGRWARYLGSFAAVLILPILGVSTYRQVHVYQDDGTLWADTVRRNPNTWVAHVNLGIVFERQGRIREAMEQFEQTLQIKPDYADAHYDLAGSLSQAGDLKGAIGQYEQALRLEPNYFDAHNNLGNVLSQAGRLPEAIRQYEQALRLKPDDAQAHSNLGVALRRTGRIEEAIAQYKQALRIKPDYPEVHYNLGNALQQTGRNQEAIEHYEQALKLRPDLTEARDALTRLRSGQ